MRIKHDLFSTEWELGRDIERWSVLTYQRGSYATCLSGHAHCVCGCQWTQLLAMLRPESLALHLGRLVSMSRSEMNQSRVSVASKAPRRPDV